jgi:hypothetical protein
LCTNNKCCYTGLTIDGQTYGAAYFNAKECKLSLMQIITTTHPNESLEKLLFDKVKHIARQHKCAAIIAYPATQSEQSVYRSLGFENNGNGMSLSLSKSFFQR